MAKNYKLTEPEIRKIWDNTHPTYGYGGRNNTLFHKDIAGTLIKITEFNKETEFGRVIDLLLPVEKGDEVEVNNSLAIHWKNAKARKETLNDWKVAVHSEIKSSNKKEFQQPLNVKSNKIIKAKDMKIKEVSSIWAKNKKS
ncbi:hypothetical protein P344_02975 [Spiroplasma mirum ATCC 29335]|uniref:Uncharacterized protein n=1 Tax=Spiroplasma mirum ATCC 29335 TaxID=838561 RepID=W0GL79_9MOLU|nr:MULTISPECIES: hypothetical protein [Spiroplasma]AHF60932.1 hypothetical protein SMM_0503 [Spiroplasma mirum ATCC 29335]AHI57939.1 hypothetical protein P344_02975 [Spiroplasma mirum ATCC 29335]AKM53041.1 hypothetical protein SATRI_v1c05600 [Spiroplasma atrichopogonis]